ncbi:hypothetical protein HMPREF0043_00697 [Actinobaculum sp. oral taxon 183 str. F0552]|nr:hypothetical protein HMPREF0043_00697 [Actinobaculum sp. oral taxon 183 str. F0552]
MHFPARSRRVRITPPRAMSSRIDRGSLNARTGCIAIRGAQCVSPDGRKPAEDFDPA